MDWPTAFVITIIVICKTIYEIVENIMDRKEIVEIEEDEV